ncbi:hypothetical protein EDC94DRAFT_596563 [Helicostylum pulchrum]|uniref:BHLH domain-containing protein n=1 Tax=Helicostylum pulchrum TaxID=562976 RepID=A0ABP9YAQ1_9FUNG|nr:hypothetical protein EDC94DRAFT_596563 [Helicostylum pulchrum]
MNKIHWSSEYLHDCPVTQQQQQYMPKMELEQQNGLMYPVSPFYASTIVSSPSASPLSSSGVIYGEPFITSPSYSMHGHHQPGSPDSLMSGLSAPLYPQHHQMPPQLVQSSSSSTIHSTSSMSSNTSAAATAYLNETIAKASALPESFYPEFLQYSKESFEQPTTHRINNKKRNRLEDDDKAKFSSSSSSSSEDDEEDDQRPSRKQKVEQQDSASNVTELRRQIHIQSEQKRRAQIKDGFEDLRTELPACLNKKMSKVTLLHRTVQHIQHLKSTQMTILAELERLVQENEQLRTFQQGVLQKQALENMYSIGNI